MFIWSLRKVPTTLITGICVTFQEEKLVVIMEQRDRCRIENFEDVLIEKTNFKKVYTLLLRWKVLPVHLEAFKDISSIGSDRDKNRILYHVIKSRGCLAFSKLQRALQLSNPEVFDQFEGRPWKISNEQWSCTPQVYNISDAKIRGSYRIVTFTENRQGWEKESTNLEKTFQFLHYKGSVTKDPTEKELDELLTDFTESKSKAGCYVFALSGHGQGLQGEENVLQPNKSYKKVNEIISKICKAPSLLGMTKLFSQGFLFPWMISYGKYCINLYCVRRGDLETLASLPYSNTSVTTSFEILDIKDTIILRPCLPGYVAYRDVELGGWFIDVLTKMIKKYAPVKDVEEVMMEVSKEFARMKETKTGFYENFEEWRYMTPCANAYSFNKFYFAPKEELSGQDTKERQCGETSSRSK